MLLLNDNIIVTFDPVAEVSGLIMPERYMIQEADTEGEHNAYGITTDRRLINPQVVTISRGEDTGKRFFVYYGAYEVAKWISETEAIISAKTLYFEIDPIKPLPGYYLGEEVFTESERTASGIWLSVEQKEGILVRITHTSSDKYKVGDIVVTIDEKQYTLKYEGKKYIKLTDRDIVGVKTETGYQPNGDRVLVEYLPDADLQERMAENSRRSSQKDFLDKHHMHYMPDDVAPLPEPKFVDSKLLAVGGDVSCTGGNGGLSGGNIIYGSIGDTLIVVRNYGCILPDNTWIVGMNNVIGTLYGRSSA